MKNTSDIPAKELFSRIGLTVGVFDYLHPGHIMMLSECRAKCEYLIVGVNDGTNLEKHKNQPIQSLKERVMMIEALYDADEVFTYSGEKGLYDILQTMEYHMRFIGSDHENKPITGDDIPGHLEKVVFTTRNHGFSSTAMKYRAYHHTLVAGAASTAVAEGYSYDDIISGNLFPKN